MQTPTPEVPVSQLLAELNFRAGKGHFGKPVRFLAGVEIECTFVDDQANSLPPKALDNARETLLEYELADLEGTVETPEDQTTLDLWRAQVSEFNAQDLLNALVYISLSRPHLRPGRGPSNDDYQSVLAHTKNYGGEAALDFRFGKKPYPYSFYDHPTVSEFSIMPVRPMVLPRKIDLLAKFIADEADWYGCKLQELGRGTDMVASAQVNLSAYHQVETEDGVKWMPVIGRDPSLRPTTADAMAGLTTGIEDGAWFSTLLGEVNHNLIGEESRERYPFTAGVARSNALRINHQWVENRMTLLQDRHDVQGTLLWMMSAITYGLEKGADTIGAMPGRSQPELRPTIVTTRTEDFDERFDAPLRQMLQSCTIHDGRLHADPQFVQTAGRKFAEAVTGKILSHKAATIFTHLFIGGLLPGEQGELKVEQAAVIAPQLLTPSDRAMLAESAKTDDVESLFVSAALLAHRAGFRTAVQDTLHSTANYPALTADEWVERLSESEIFRRAYGRSAAKYAAQLGQYIKTNPHTKN